MRIFFRAPTPEPSSPQAIKPATALATSRTITVDDGSEILAVRPEHLPAEDRCSLRFNGSGWLGFRHAGLSSSRVPASVPVDGGLQIDDGAEDPAPQALAGQS